jgi:hypothetical protein
MHRLGDVLERRVAKIGHREVEASLDLPVGLLGEADRARLGDALQPRRDIDAVAHEVAVALLDHIADMDADAELNPLVLWHARIAFDHRPLDFHGAVHRVHHAAEFDDAAVAGALDDATMVHGDGRIDQVAAKGPQARQNAILVGSGEPRVADDIRHQNCRKLSGLAHRTSPFVRMLALRVVKSQGSVGWAAPKLSAETMTTREGMKASISVRRSARGKTTDIRRSPSFHLR